MADATGSPSGWVETSLPPGLRAKIEGDIAMLRVRLKADGRIVEILPDGSEKTIDHQDPAAFARQVRARCGLTQAAFAQRIEVPIETVRNWEQGKRSPRGPARALLKLIDQAPEVAFAALGGKRR